MLQMLINGIGAVCGTIATVFLCLGLVQMGRAFRASPENRQPAETMVICFATCVACLLAGSVIVLALSALGRLFGVLPVVY